MIIGISIFQSLEATSALCHTSKGNGNMVTIGNDNPVIQDIKSPLKMIVRTALCKVISASLMIDSDDELPLTMSKFEKGDVYIDVLIDIAMAMKTLTNNNIKMNNISEYLIDKKEASLAIENVLSSLSPSEEKEIVSEEELTLENLLKNLFK